MGCQRINPHWPCASQAPYLLCYLSSLLLFFYYLCCCCCCCYFQYLALLSAGLCSGDPTQFFPVSEEYPTDASLSGPYLIINFLGDHHQQNLGKMASPQCWGSNPGLLRVNYMLTLSAISPTICKRFNFSDTSVFIFLFMCEGQHPTVLRSYS